jgi:hypothetical protein
MTETASLKLNPRKGGRLMIKMKTVTTTNVEKGMNRSIIRMMLIFLMMKMDALLAAPSAIPTTGH